MPPVDPDAMQCGPVPGTTQRGTGQRPRRRHCAQARALDGVSRQEERVKAAEKPPSADPVTPLAAPATDNWEEMTSRMAAAMHLATPFFTHRNVQFCLGEMHCYQLENDLEGFCRVQSWLDATIKELQGGVSTRRSRRIDGKSTAINWYHIMASNNKPAGSSQAAAERLSNTYTPATIPLSCNRPAIARSRSRMPPAPVVTAAAEEQHAARLLTLAQRHIRYSETAVKTLDSRVKRAFENMAASASTASSSTKQTRQATDTKGSNTSGSSTATTTTTAKSDDDGDDLARMGAILTAAVRQARLFAKDTDVRGWLGAMVRAQLDGDTSTFRIFRDSLELRIWEIQQGEGPDDVWCLITKPYDEAL
ncbi:hypothetical protein Micbo1qcDRAFT_180515 [Microdochium bolleyi]|uniref:Uncharacterized protein n=1 Tax=Microdochium bolleyi TaxID=196109 RepID=A0A136ILA4_9PEZI|nr:hypothetical protein Micbo1qcDRAFT_180515 [Microdochium bolleyi]